MENYQNVNKKINCCENQRKIDTSEDKENQVKRGSKQQMKRKLFNDFVVDVQRPFANDT